MDFNRMVDWDLLVSEEGQVVQCVGQIITECESANNRGQDHDE